MTDTAHPLTASARRAYAALAAVAWTGVLLTMVLSVLGAYDESTPDPGLYGDTGDGLGGAMSRLADTLSYFTIWSNVVAAASATLMLARPLRAGLVRRVVLVDALLMITITALVYQVVLAPAIDVTGWSNLTDPILHVLTPILTVGVWAWCGPRGWVTGRLVPFALVVPCLWIVWMLVRGAVVDAYPYGFVNVVDLGYATVAVNLAMILVLGLVVAAVFWGLDVALGRRQRSRAI